MIRRRDQEHILSHIDVGRKLDYAEDESVRLLELNPTFGYRRFIESFMRKRRIDAQRTIKKTR